MTVKELITLLLDYDMGAEVEVSTEHMEETEDGKTFYHVNADIMNISNVMGNVELNVRYLI